MKLTDLVDLEARLIADRGVDRAELQARDRAIYGDLGIKTSDRPRLLAAWLEALRAKEGRSLGARVAAAHRALATLLVIAGGALGWGAAVALLSAPPGEPVDAGSFVLVLVVGQIFLLLLLLVAGPFAVVGGDRVAALPIVGDFRAGMRWLVRTVAGAGARLDASRAARWREALDRMGGRASLYGGAERWTLLGLGQLFGVAFNVGVLAYVLRAGVPRGLAFGWSSTLLEATPERVHAALAVLSTPWTWLWADGVPTLEALEATRWLPSPEARFAGAPTSDHASLWWHFLVTSVTVYGLAPRVLTLVLAQARRRRALSSVPLDTPEIDRVLRRMISPTVRTRASEDEEDGASSPAASEPPPWKEGARYAVVAWRDFPADPEELDRVVKSRLFGRVGRRFSAGGADYGADGGVIESLAEEEKEPVLILAEAWEAPDRGTLAFISALRAGVGADRRLIVGLANPDRDGDWLAPEKGEMEVWRRRLASLRDPYLGLEELVSPS